MSLEDIASVTISSTSAQPTRAGFGTPLLAAYHTKNVDRVRSYTSLTALVADGLARSFRGVPRRARDLRAEPTPRG